MFDHDRHGRLRVYHYPPTVPDPIVKYTQSTPRGVDPYLDHAVDVVHSLSTALRAGIAGNNDWVLQEHQCRITSITVVQFLASKACP